MSDPEHKQINSKLDSILKILNGNGKLGIVAKCQLAYDWMLQMKKDKHSMVMILYRTVLVIFLGFIAMKVGLK